jgi:hypothetical protein
MAAVLPNAVAYNLDYYCKLYNKSQKQFKVNQLIQNFCKEETTKIWQDIQVRFADYAAEKESNFF